MNNPRELAGVLQEALGNGQSALTFEDIAVKAMKIRTRDVTEKDVDAVRYYLPRARNWLEKWNICTILVTEFYFDNHYGRREPQSAARAKLCVALHGRLAAGIRLLTRKGVKDDVLGITWLWLNSRSASGIQSAILRRIAIEHSEDKLTLPEASKLARNTLAYKLPEHHDDELVRLITRARISKLETKNGNPFD
jgi:hypothetical protein